MMFYRCKANRRNKAREGLEKLYGAVILRMGAMLCFSPALSFPLAHTQDRSLSISIYLEAPLACTREIDFD